MRILYSALTEYFWMHIVEVVNNLAEMGHEVHVAGFLKSRPKRLHPSVVFYNITLSNRGFREAIDRDFWKNLLRYGHERLLSGQKLSFYESWILHLLDNTSFDLVYERRNDFNPAIALAKKYGIPSILEINGIQSIEFKWKGYKPDEIKHLLDNELRAIEDSTKVICVAQGIRDYFVEKGFNPNKFKIIPNGVNIDLFYPMDKEKCRQQSGFLLNDRIIGFTGSMQFFYEIDCAIKAMPKILRNFPDTRFVVVGREYPFPLGHSKDTLRALARQLGVLSKIDFLPPVPYEKVPTYINSFDVCLLPIVKREKWYAGISPLKFREYLACGKPVVASNVPGEAQMVREIGAGLLYEPGNPESLADNICTILKDKQLTKQMGENGHKNVLTRGTWKQAAEKILMTAEETIKEVNYRGCEKTLSASLR